MDILPRVRTTIKRCLRSVPPKWKTMMTLGINALSLSPFVSLNSNARMIHPHPASGMRQIARLCAHPHLCNIFSSLLLALFSITDESVICVDFTIFDPFAVLVFALQTKDGRAIPVWLDVIRYPVEKDSQNIFILDTLREFLAVIGCHPTIVCDRGFIGEHLIRGFLDLGLVFCVRMKAGKTWMVGTKKHVLKHQKVLDQTGVMYGETLRVVRSSKTLQRTLQAKECWYILTNDTIHSRAEILDAYYHRFEIEECFKDIKHLLHTNPRWFQKEQTLKTLLWFQVFGIWMLSTVKSLPPIILLFTPTNKHKKLSWIRRLFEWMTRERTLLLISYGMQRKGVIAV